MDITNITRELLAERGKISCEKFRATEKEKLQQNQQTDITQN